MSEAPWPRRPQPTVPDQATAWRGAPVTPGDLTLLRRQLHRDLGAGALPQQTTDADLERLLLAFEELASNGLRHGRPPVLVAVTADDSGWLLDVSDAAVDLPPAPAIGRDAAAGGLGLHLVAALAAAHGWAVTGERKHVWVRIDVAAPARGSPSAAMPGLRSRRVVGARLRDVLTTGAGGLGFLPTLRLTGPVDELTSDVVTDLLVALGEALANVARHARAGSVDVGLAVARDGVTLQVLDDGIGVAGARRDGGLADLHRRAAWHNGALTVQPGPTGGTLLTWSARRRPPHPELS